MRNNSRTTELRFVFGAGVLTRFQPVEYEDDTPHIMFVAGPFGVEQARVDTGEMAVAQKKDIVLLEFEKGKEKKGPSNFVVFKQEDSGLETYFNCSLWAQADPGLSIIVPRGQSFGFASDGVKLWRVTKVPTQALGPGFARAKHALHRAARRIPEDLLMQAADY